MLLSPFSNAKVHYLLIDCDVEVRLWSEQMTSYFGRITSLQRQYGHCEVCFVNFLVLKSDKLMFIVDILMQTVYRMNSDSSRNWEAEIICWTVKSAAGKQLILRYYILQWRVVEVFESTLSNEPRKLSSVEIISVLMFFDEWSMIILKLWTLELPNKRWSCLLYSLIFNGCTNPFIIFIKQTRAGIKYQCAHW